MAHTPWGDLPIGDAHVHFFSHEFFAGLARQKKTDSAEALGLLLGWEIPPADPAVLAERWLQELNKHHVQRAALIASAPGDEGSVARAVALHRERFYGMFLLDPTQADAVERVKKAAADGHLDCVCLFPAMHRYSVKDDRVAAVLEVASAERLVVFVHCGVLSVGVRKKLGLPCPFDLSYSNPIDLHSVALRYPQVRFVVPHFGAGMFREALMLGDLCGNVYLDTSSTNRWMEYEGWDLRSVFRRSIEVMGVERLLFGTDSSFFPRGWQPGVLDAQSKVLYELGLEDEQARAILGGNLDLLMRR